MEEYKQTLTRIIEVNREVSTARRRYEECKQASKIAKDHYDACVSRLEETIRAESDGPGPLFANLPGEGSGEIALNEREGGAIASARGRSSDRPLTTLPGLSAKAIDVLRHAPFRTVPEFVTWTQAGNKLQDLPGANEQICESILDAVSEAFGDDDAEAEDEIEE